MATVAQEVKKEQENLQQLEKLSNAALLAALSVVLLAGIYFSALYLIVNYM